MKEIFEINDFNDKSDNNVIVNCIVEMKINNFNDNAIVEVLFHLLILYLTCFGRYYERFRITYFIFECFKLVFAKLSCIM